MQDSAVPIDGRAARAARTRDAIVDACVALVERGDVRPTAPRVAERAGVSVRSVFQHFDDLPALYTAVVRKVVERLAVLVVPVDPSLPLEQRITTFAHHRGNLLEAVTPFRRAAAVHGPFSPELREALAEGAAYLRREVADTFGAELSSAAPADRRELLDALAVATSWGAWDSLRSEAGDTRERAQAVVERMLTALLTPHRA